MKKFPSYDIIRAMYSQNEAELIAFGQAIGEKLRSGDILVLSGDLGAGKTCLTKGIAKGLNRPVSVLSGEEKNLDAYRYQHNSITFIQYQAGAMGGNFQLANKIIYFSLPQGSELWEQSQKRIHRLGQERPCF